MKLRALFAVACLAALPAWGTPPPAPLSASAAPPPAPPSASAPRPVPADPEAEPFHPECDAGDEAWVRHVVPVLLGRRPFGVREVQLLTSVTAQIGRRAAAAALMKLPAFEDRWADFLLDDVRAERAGLLVQEDCFGRPLRPAPDKDLAAFMRSHEPLQAAPGGPFTMADVLRSSLQLDDLTPFFEADLFAMLTRQGPPCNNVSDAENDRSARLVFGASFDQVFLHRNVVCAECHNAEASPTMSSNPKTNRFWPADGAFEKALWGDQSGRTPDEAFAVFRVLGVRTSDFLEPNAPPSPDAVTPWGMDAACGAFLPPGKIGDDAAAVQGYLGAPLHLRATVWDTVRELRAGVAELRAGKDPFPPTSAPMDGGLALASLLAQSIVQEVWADITGAPLSLAHGFPRNEAQRKLLVRFTRRLVASGWSLRALLLEYVTHPLFNQRAPADGCGPVAYGLPAVVNPWSFDDPDPERKLNGPGDLLTRLNGRVLLSAAAAALEWPKPAAFPGSAEADLQSSVGAAVDRIRRGFPDPDFNGLLAWEDRFGTCAPPRPVKHDVFDAKAPTDRCAGRCDQGIHFTKTQKDQRFCSCDSSCASHGDCCADYQDACVSGAPPPEDWMNRLVQAAQRSKPRVTLRDLVVAVRDRLWSDPTLDAAEEPVTRDYFHVQSLDEPLADAAALEPKLRLYCGVLLKAPQFMLSGAPIPPPRGPAPKLVVGNATSEALCQALAPSVSQVTGRPVKCDGDSVRVER